MKTNFKLILALLFAGLLMLPRDMFAQQTAIWISEFGITDFGDEQPDTTFTNFEAHIYEEGTNNFLACTKITGCGIAALDIIHYVDAFFKKPNGQSLLFSDVANLSVYLQVIEKDDSTACPGAVVIPPDDLIGASAPFAGSGLQTTKVMQFGSVIHLTLGAMPDTRPDSPEIEVKEIEVTGESDGFGKLEIEVHINEKGTDRFLGCSGQINGLRGVDVSGTLYKVNARFTLGASTSRTLTYFDVQDKDIYLVVIEDDSGPCPCQFGGPDDHVGTTPPFSGAILSEAQEFKNFSGLKCLAIGLAGVPDRVVLASPADLSVVNQTNIDFAWVPVSNTQQYQFQLATDSLMTNLLVNSTLPNSSIAISTSGLTQAFHYWRVRAQNDIGWGLYSNRNSFVFTGPPANPPATPTLAMPVDRVENQPTTLTLSWNTSQSAAAYQLQVSTSSDFSTIIVDEPGLTTSSRQVGPLASNTVHYWRVGAQNSAGSSPFSGIWSFTTIVQLPSQVALISPAHDALIETDNAQFTWNQGQSSVERYWFELATDSTMTNSVIDSTLTAADTVKTLGQLVNMQTYWWRVRAGNAAGWGPFSEQRRFRIDFATSVLADLQVPVEFSLSQNYPNPFNPETTIKYTIPQRESGNQLVTLRIFNLMGQAVRTLVNEQKTSGSYQIVWDGRSDRGRQMASGVYLFTITAAEFRAVRRMTVLK